MNGVFFQCCPSFENCPQKAKISALIAHMRELFWVWQGLRTVFWNFDLSWFSSYFLWGYYGACAFREWRVLPWCMFAAFVLVSRWCVCESACIWEGFNLLHQGFELDLSFMVTCCLVLAHARLVHRNKRPLRWVRYRQKRSCQKYFSCDVLQTTHHHTSLLVSLLLNVSEHLE